MDHFEAKQQSVKELFKGCVSLESVYKKIMELGKLLPPFPEGCMRAENLVEGCQSRLYLVSKFCNQTPGTIRFHAHSDALISSGLAYLLLHVYDNEPPECLLQRPPTFLEELGIPNALTPSRSNGLSSLHLRMKRDALKYLVIQNTIY